jgi:hypothetical protein
LFVGMEYHISKIYKSRIGSNFNAIFTIFLNFKIDREIGNWDDFQDFFSFASIARLWIP